MRTSNLSSIVLIIHSDRPVLLSHGDYELTTGNFGQSGRLKSHQKSLFLEGSANIISKMSNQIPSLLDFNTTPVISLLQLENKPSFKDCVAQNCSWYTKTSVQLFNRALEQFGLKRNMCDK